MGEMIVRIFDKYDSASYREFAQAYTWFVHDSAGENVNPLDIVWFEPTLLESFKRIAEETRKKADVEQMFRDLAKAHFEFMRTRNDLLYGKMHQVIAASAHGKSDYMSYLQNVVRNGGRYK